MASWNEPLDLEYWLVNTFSGSVEIFVFLAFIMMAGMAAYFRMQNTILLIMIALFTVMMARYMGGMYVLVVLVAGLLTFYSISKIMKR